MLKAPYKSTLWLLLLAALVGSGVLWLLFELQLAQWQHKDKVVTQLPLSQSNSICDSPLNTTLKIAVDEWPPYLSIDNGQLTGELGSALASTLRRSGLKCQIISTEWPRALQMLRNGEVAAIFPAVDTADRHEDFMFTKSLHTISGHGLVTYIYEYQGPDPAFPAAKSASKGDLNRPLVGVVQDYYYLSELVGANARLDYSTDEEELLKKLTRGRISQAIADEAVADYIIARSFASEARGFVKLTNGQRATATGYSLMINKRNTSGSELIRAINEVLEEKHRVGH